MIGCMNIPKAYSPSCSLGAIAVNHFPYQTALKNEFEIMSASLSKIGYQVINTKMGQMLFRQNPLGRAFVRWAGSLSRMLPLQAPQSVMIDICNVCNFKCSFCPTADRELLKEVGRPKGTMSLSLFKKIIDDLKVFNGNIAVISLHKDGEPLLNNHVVEMVKYAKAARVAGTIEITTNASRLFPALADSLIDAGLDSIRISVEQVSSDGYKKIVNNFDDYDTILKNVEYLYRSKKRRRSNLHVLAKIINVGLSQSEKDKFISDFGPIADVARIEGIMGWSHSELKDFTLGLKPTVGMDGLTPLKMDRIVCPEPFKMLAINFNGEVSPCCDDWAMQLIVGNLNKQSVKDVWRGESINKIRRLHLQNKRGELGACAKCQYMLGVTDLFDLDKSRDDLLRFYS